MQHLDTPDRLDPMPPLPQFIDHLALSRRQSSQRGPYFRSVLKHRYGSGSRGQKKRRLPEAKSLWIVPRGVEARSTQISVPPCRGTRTGGCLARPPRTALSTAPPFRDRLDAADQRQRGPSVAGARGARPGFQHRPLSSLGPSTSTSSSDPGMAEPTTSHSLPSQSPISEAPVRLIQ
jgi:hypothetical protein